VKRYLDRIGVPSPGVRTALPIGSDRSHGAPRRTANSNPLLVWESAFGCLDEVVVVFVFVGFVFEVIRRGSFGISPKCLAWLFQLLRLFLHSQSGSRDGCVLFSRTKLGVIFPPHGPKMGFVAKRFASVNKEKQSGFVDAQAVSQRRSSARAGPCQRHRRGP